MAIDTAEKRRSAGGVPFLPFGPNITPNVAKDADWRQQAAWSYSGIDVGTEGEGADTAWLSQAKNLIHRRRHRNNAPRKRPPPPPHYHRH